MKTVEAIKSLEKYVMFDLNTFRHVIGEKSSYARLLLHRMKKNGHVFQIQKNRYTLYKDPFLIASRIVWPSYISLWSALRYYNLTEQIPHDIWVVTSRKTRRKMIKYSNANIIFIYTKPKYFFGFKKIISNNFEIFIAEPEKVLIDSMLFRKISFSEIASVIKNNRKDLNIKKLVGFAVKIENKALIKRLGYLLEKLGMDYYPRLKKYVYPAYTPLEYNLPSEGKRIEKWKIIENMVID